jgi:hypothetical protein
MISPRGVGCAPRGDSCGKFAVWYGSRARANRSVGSDILRRMGLVPAAVSVADASYFLVSSW